VSDSGQGVTDTEGADGWLNKLYKGLSAPLLITVVGAILAGYLIPRIASEVEDHRKAREIQTSLVQDMSEAVAPVIGTGRLLATRTIEKAGKNTTEVFNDTLIEWETNRRSIAARLSSYFADASFEGTTLPEAWDLYSDAVDDLYYLSTTLRRDRCKEATELRKYLEPDGAKPRCAELDTNREPQACQSAKDEWRILGLCDEDSLKGEKGYARGENYFQAYRSISDMVLERQRALLDAVRTSIPAGF
jgi:hypothetical protein